VTKSTVFLTLFLITLPYCILSVRKQKAATMKFVKHLILSILILGTFSFALATERYVRSDASGNQTGTDWANAHTQLPSSLVRGDIYYVADGSYPSYTFNDAESGTSLITVKKATQADHGTDTGWVTAYGDGVAEFAPITFHTGYFVFEGTTGSGKSGHGFKIKGTSAGQQLVKFPFEYTQTDITISHTEIEHRGLDTGTKDRGGLCNSRK